MTIDETNEAYKYSSADVHASNLSGVPRTRYRAARPLPPITSSRVTHASSTEYPPPRREKGGWGECMDEPNLMLEIRKEWQSTASAGLRRRSRANGYSINKASERGRGGRKRNHVRRIPSTCSFGICRTSRRCYNCMDPFCFGFVVGGEGVFIWSTSGCGGLRGCCIRLGVYHFLFRTRTRNRGKGRLWIWGLSADSRDTYTWAFIPCTTPRYLRARDRHREERARARARVCVCVCVCGIPVNFCMGAIVGRIMGRGSLWRQNVLSVAHLCRDSVPEPPIIMIIRARHPSYAN